MLILDDILDTGRTLHEWKLRSKRAEHTIQHCVLLDKPSRRVADVHAEWVGFTIPDHFVVGFGLDTMALSPFAGCLRAERPVTAGTTKDSKIKKKGLRVI